MSYPQPAPPVDRVVNGVLANVEQRQGGFYRFSIQEPGMNYPTRVDTKKVELIQQALSLMGQQVSAQVRDQEQNKVNPNTGTNYVNHYLNEIAPAGYTPGVIPTQPGTPQSPQPQQQVQVQPQVQVQQWEPPQQATVAPQPDFQMGLAGWDKDVNIMRQCASKAAVEMLDILPPEKQTMRGLIECAEAWMAYYLNGPYRWGVQPLGSLQPDERADQEAVYQAVNTDPQDGRSHGVCPDCGFSGGDHLPGCPRGIPEETAA